MISRDLTPLAGLTNLTELFLQGNSIEDLTPVAGLTNLTWLRLGGIGVSDLTPLAGLTNLTRLGVGSMRGFGFDASRRADQPDRTVSGPQLP